MTPAFALGAVAVYGNRLEKMVLGLDNITFIHYNVIVIGVWRSLVSRLVRVQEASGSNPDTPTMASLWGLPFFIPIVFWGHCCVKEDKRFFCKRNGLWNRLRFYRI